MTKKKGLIQQRWHLLPPLRKVEQLSKPILINPVALTLLILFNIPEEIKHKSGGNVDPKSKKV